MTKTRTEDERDEQIRPIWNIADRVSYLCREYLTAKRDSRRKRLKKELEEIPDLLSSKIDDLKP